MVQLLMESEMTEFTGTRIGYLAYPSNADLCLQIIKEEWLDGIVSTKQIIHEAVLSADQNQMVYIEVLDHGIEVRDIKTDLVADDCDHVVVANFDKPCDEKCCECGNPAQFLVKSKNSTLVNGYCSRHVPAPLWDYKTKQVMVRIVG